MDDSTKTMMLTIATGIIKKGLLVAGTGLASHGLINSNRTETFVSIGMVVIGAGWSFWNDYGRAIVLSQLEVLKAKSLAQAAKLKDNGIKPVTVSEIAAQHDTLSTADVTKTIATLPADVHATVAKAAAAALALLILGSLAFPQPSIAQVTGNIAADIAAAAKRKQAATQGCDPLNLKPGCREQAEKATVSKVSSLVTKPMQDVVNFITGGLDDAADLAIAIPDLQDGNGYACWRQFRAAGAVLKLHPIPLTLNVAADLEAIRLVHMTVTRICQNPACTQVFSEATNVIVAAAPLTLQIPSITELCAKIPPIAIVAPSDLPTPLPSPTPSLGIFAPSTTPTPTPSPTPSPTP